MGASHHSLCQGVHECGEIISFQGTRHGHANLFKSWRNRVRPLSFMSGTRDFQDLPIAIVVAFVAEQDRPILSLKYPTPAVSH